MAHGPDLLRDGQLTPGLDFRCDGSSCFQFAPPDYFSEFRISEFRKKSKTNIKKREIAFRRRVGGVSLNKIARRS
jgi:hypothetical protein